MAHGCLGGAQTTSVKDKSLAYLIMRERVAEAARGHGRSDGVFPMVGIPVTPVRAQTVSSPVSATIVTMPTSTPPTPCQRARAHRRVPSGMARG